MARIEEQRAVWEKQCAPVFVQPTCDVENGYGLARVFYNWSEDNTVVRVSLVLDGEASYWVTSPATENKTTTYFYRSFNMKTYGRTADVNYLEYRGVNLSSLSHRDGSSVGGAVEDATTKPWSSIFTTDHSGTQTWARGNKGVIWPFFSLMYHYKETVPYGEWEKAPGFPHRPRIFFCTSNHMMAQYDANPDMEKHTWMDYIQVHGSAEDAISFAKAEIQVKPNWYSK